MKKIIVLTFFVTALSLYAQERTDLIGKRFEGAINKMIAGDSINSINSMRILFLKDKAIIQEEKLSATNKPRLIYKVEVAWRINKRNNQIIFSAGAKPYPYQDYTYYFRNQELTGLYKNDDTGAMGLDILFAETEAK